MQCHNHDHSDQFDFETYLPRVLGPGHRMRPKRCGFTTKYMHLDSIDPTLEVGAAVSARAPLGTLGNTGTSSHGAHLHFELEHNDAHVDPEPFVRAWR